jgi:hypothetical protein
LLRYLCFLLFKFPFPFKDKKRAPLWQMGEPASVGKILKPWSGRAKLLDDYWERE